MLKIILGGPPQSGKSCLRYGLKEAFKRRQTDVYPYVITACPDGEGSWFQETVSSDANLAMELKENYKRSFTHEYVELWAESVKNCTTELTLVDIGGIPSDQNRVICEHATHAILVAGDVDELSEWRLFCSELEITVIAEIHSDYYAVADTTLTLSSDGVYRGSVHHLERGDNSVADRPTIKQLAGVLERMVKES